MAARYGSTIVQERMIAGTKRMDFPSPLKRSWGFVLLFSLQTGELLALVAGAEDAYHFGIFLSQNSIRDARCRTDPNCRHAEIYSPNKERRLVMKEFESHETHEAVYVRRYREMFQRMQNPLVKFLVELILADEEKHHTVLQSMTSTLKGSLTWTWFETALEGLYNLGPALLGERISRLA